MLVVLDARTHEPACAARRARPRMRARRRQVARRRLRFWSGAAVGALAQCGISSTTNRQRAVLTSAPTRMSTPRAPYARPLGARAARRRALRGARRARRARVCTGAQSCEQLEGVTRMLARSPPRRAFAFVRTMASGLGSMRTPPSMTARAACSRCARALSLASSWKASRACSRGLRRAVRVRFARHHGEWAWISSARPCPRAQAPRG